MKQGFLIGFLAFFWFNIAFSGNQREEDLANSTLSLMQRSIADNAPPKLMFNHVEEGVRG